MIGKDPELIVCSVLVSKGVENWRLMTLAVKEYVWVFLLSLVCRFCQNTDMDRRGVSGVIEFVSCSVSFAICFDFCVRPISSNRQKF